MTKIMIWTGIIVSVYCAISIICVKIHEKIKKNANK